MDGLRTVKPGEAVVHSAAGHNAIVRAAQAHRNRQGQGRQQGGGDLPLGSVLVRNASGGAVSRFGVLGISGVVITPTVGEASFFAEPCFEGVTPTVATRNWVVLQEPLEAGAVGRAIVSGLTHVRMTVLAGEEDFNYAEVAGTTDHVRPVASGQAEILYRESGLGSKRALVRMSNTPSSGAGQVLLGIVKAPSTNGAVSSSYTVDVYGTTIDSLDEAPTLEDVTALQFPAELRYWRAEVVALTRVGDSWFIQKLLTVPAAYEADAGQIALRIGRPGTTGSTVPTNFLVDLNSCLATFAGGTVLDAIYIAFSYGSFGGWGDISLSVAVPVRMSGSWNMCTLVLAGTSFATVHAAMVSGTPVTLATTQDTVAPVAVVTDTLSAKTWQGTETFAPGVFVHEGPVGPTNTEVLAIAGLVTWSNSFLLSAQSAAVQALFASLPALPSIPGAVDSLHLLVGYIDVSIFASSSGSTADPVTLLNPFAAAVAAIPSSGRAITGSYATHESPSGFAAVVVS